MDKFSINDALTALAQVPEKSIALFTHGSLTIKYYRPQGRDEQVPHDQDEVYVIAAGNGVFSVGGDAQPFETGDALFVAAGVPHCFEAFSDDFGAWVVFYGPAGGESND